MKNIKKLFFVLLLLVMAFVFVGCSKTNDDLEEEVASLTSQVAELQTKLDALISSSTEDKDSIKVLTNKINSLIAEINAIKEVLNQATYTINIYDIDGELLATATVVGSVEDEVFETLKENFDVQYTESQYGPYITSIENSIVDGNYYIAIYENEEYSLVGINDLVIDDGDVFDFKVECWNTNFDEIDLAVDQFIYSFFKNNLDKLCTSTTIDYSLLGAIGLMIDNGYDSNVFNSNFVNKEDCIKAISGSYADVTSIGILFKAAVACDFFGVENESLKTAVSSLSDASSLQSIYSIPFYLVACEKMGIKNETYSTVKSAFSSILISNGTGDSVCMALDAYATYTDLEDYATTITTVLTAEKDVVSEDGVTDTWSGLNCASTAQLVLALACNNENARTYYDYDLIKALLAFAYDGLFLYKSDSTSADLSFSTPQGIAALLAYKVCRDKEMAAPIYK